ncbi:Nucleoporin GLE1 [Porphyridium purpureum]|uniref:mRNA export factor GLE1 n=1 Tax=Porphyridium purpureum TaxID=35688 RepID=A0A5J4Z1D0_PORPP|nr:Nucleoporin GLE1 [Porphyridium purpureum]|eukprot:POR4910..scf208_2
MSAAWDNTSSALDVVRSARRAALDQLRASTAIKRSEAPRSTSKTEPGYRGHADLGTRASSESKNRGAFEGGPAATFLTCDVAGSDLDGKEKAKRVRRLLAPDFDTSDDDDELEKNGPGDSMTKPAEKVPHEKRSLKALSSRDATGRGGDAATVESARFPVSVDAQLVASTMDLLRMRVNAEVDYETVARIQQAHAQFQGELLDRLKKNKAAPVALDANAAVASLDVRRFDTLPGSVHGRDALLVSNSGHLSRTDRLNAMRERHARARAQGQDWLRNIQEQEKKAEIERIKREEQIREEERVKQAEVEAVSLREKQRQHQLEEKKRAQQKINRDLAVKEAAVKRAGRQAEQDRIDRYELGSKAAMDEGGRLERWLQGAEARARRFETDTSQSRNRLQIKKEVNLAINQIAASIKQINLKMGALHTTLTKAKALSAEALAFAENTIAARVMKEAAGQITLHSDSAFPVAAVLAALMAVYPDIKDLLIAHFHRECIYTVPMYVRRSPDQSQEDYYQSTLGMKPGEKVESYHERMGGYVTLYAALVQTQNAESLGIGPNPYGIEHGWMWLARTVNMKPRNVSCLVLISFLEICGYRLFREYGRQFEKLMRLVHKSYLPAVPDSAPAGPRTRLAIYVSEFLTSCQLPVPKGSVLPEKDAEVEDPGAYDDVPQGGGNFGFFG